MWNLTALFSTAALSLVSSTDGAWAGDDAEGILEAGFFFCKEVGWRDPRFVQGEGS